MTAELAHAPDGPFMTSGLEIETPAARLAADLKFRDGFARLDAGYRLTLADAAVLSQPLGFGLAGRGVVQGRAQGPISNPELDGELTLTGAQVAGFALGRLDLAYRARDLPTSPRGRLDVTATPAFGALEAGADYVFAQSTLRLTGLRAESQGTRAAGALSLPTDGRPLAGALEIRAADLGPWLALGGIAGGGAATAELRLSGDGPGQAAEARAELTGFRWRLAEDAPLEAARLNFTLSTSDLMASSASFGSTNSP